MKMHVREQCDHLLEKRININIHNGNISASIKEKSWRNFHPTMDNDLRSNLGLHGTFTLYLLSAISVYKEHYLFLNQENQWLKRKSILSYYRFYIVQYTDHLPLGQVIIMRKTSTGNASLFFQNDNTHAFQNLFHHTMSPPMSLLSRYLWLTLWAVLPSILV